MENVLPPLTFENGWCVEWFDVVVLLLKVDMGANDETCELVEDAIPVLPPIQSEYLDPALARNPPRWK